MIIFPSNLLLTLAKCFLMNLLFDSNIDFPKNLCISTINPFFYVSSVDDGFILLNLSKISFTESVECRRSVKRKKIKKEVFEMNVRRILVFVVLFIFISIGGGAFGLDYEDESDRGFKGSALQIEMRNLGK